MRKSAKYQFLWNLANVIVNENINKIARKFSSEQSHPRFLRTFKVIYHSPSLFLIHLSPFACRKFTRVYMQFMTAYRAKEFRKSASYQDYEHIYSYRLFCSVSTAGRDEKSEGARIRRVAAAGYPPVYRRRGRRER